jgi:hypothetical protein
MSISASCSTVEKDTDSNDDDDDEGFKYPVKVSDIFFILTYF